MEETEKKKMKWWQIALIVIGVLILISVVFGGDSSNDVGENTIQTAQNVTNKSENKYTLGDTFVFDDLEITIGNEFTFVTLENQFSEHNGADVIRLPITVKNQDEETKNLNMFYIKVFGCQGTQLDTVSTYFLDDCIEFAGELRNGASYTKYLYFLYDGDGEYEVAFDNYITNIRVDFNINK